MTALGKFPRGTGAPAVPLLIPAVACGGGGGGGPQFADIDANPILTSDARPVSRTERRCAFRTCPAPTAVPANWPFSVKPFPFGLGTTAPTRPGPRQPTVRVGTGTTSGPNTALTKTHPVHDG